LLEQPPPIQQAQIVAKKTPTLSRSTHLFIAAFAEAIQSYPLEKTPAISEMNDLAVIMEKMGWPTLTPDLREILFPVLIKRPKDLGNMRTKDKFAEVIYSATKRLPKITRAYDEWEEAQASMKSLVPAEPQQDTVAHPSTKSSTSPEPQSVAEPSIKSFPSPEPQQDTVAQAKKLECIRAMHELQQDIAAQQELDDIHAIYEPKQDYSSVELEELEIVHAV
jgi:hypothetical protein